MNPKSTNPGIEIPKTDSSLTSSSNIAEKAYVYHIFIYSHNVIKLAEHLPVMLEILESLVAREADLETK